jgi:hypothetical protein
MDVQPSGGAIVRVPQQSSAVSVHSAFTSEINMGVHNLHRELLKWGRDVSDNPACLTLLKDDHTKVSGLRGLVCIFFLKCDSFIKIVRY